MLIAFFFNICDALQFVIGKFRGSRWEILTATIVCMKHQLVQNAREILLQTVQLVRGKHGTRRRVRQHEGAMRDVVATKCYRQFQNLLHVHKLKLKQKCQQRNQYCTEEYPCSNLMVLCEVCCLSCCYHICYFHCTLCLCLFHNIDNFPLLFFKFLHVFTVIFLVFYSHRLCSFHCKLLNLNYSLVRAFVCHHILHSNSYVPSQV